MPTQHLPILQTIATAWADTARAIRAMPLVAGCALTVQALVALCAFLAVDVIVLNSGRSVSEWLASPAWFVTSILDGGIRIVLLAPFTIAIHRYVIRCEAASRYPLQPLRPSYQRYVGTALGLLMIWRVPDMINVLLPSNLPLVVNLWIFAATALLMVVVAIVVLQRITLFAAIAAYAPHASWRETKPAGAGNLLRIVAVLAGVLGPCFVAGLLLRVWLFSLDWPNTKFLLALTFSLAFVQYVAIGAVAAAVSRIYLAIGATSPTAQSGAAERPAAA